MINIAFVTNSKAPYRKLQFEKISENKEYFISVFYTKKNDTLRAWNVENIKGVTEKYLKGFFINERLGAINIGLNKIVKENDIIIIGGYEQPTYIFLSILCKLHRKKSILLFDGINPNRIKYQQNWIKNKIKNIVIKNSVAIYGNGFISKKYFSEIFSYNRDKIFNQFLTVDIEKINEISNKRSDELKEKYREIYNLKDKFVIAYSGRLIESKNIEVLVEAVASINDSNISVLIIGDGPERGNIEKLASKLNVDLVITGFISKQEELFKHYQAIDLFVFPSKDDAWGLVVNEAMAAMKPIIVSDSCGCIYDLVINSHNGYIFESGNVKELAMYIERIYHEDYLKMGARSKEIIDKWTLNDGKKSFDRMILQCK